MPLPSVLGKYELLESLATGGMAELSIARSRGPAGVHKTVVVKQILAEFAENPRYVERFIEEARIGVALHHPNIAQVYELDRSGGVWFMAMEYVRGRDLNQLLRTVHAAGERVSDAFAVYVAADVCRGLHQAHTLVADGLQGVVHRDVSPHNVLLGFDGAVKLVDFGLAGERGTVGGRAKGVYASPEAVRGEPSTPAVDLFGVGVMLQEMLSGCRPLAGVSPSERAACTRLPDLADSRPDLDADLLALVRRTVAPQPSDRPVSAAVLEESLRAWLYAHGQRVDATWVGKTLTEHFPESAIAPVRPSLHAFARDLALLEDAPSFQAPTAITDVRAGERKQVTVLVIDVDGLTDLSAKLDPESFFRRQFRLLRWLRRIVDRWGGVLQRAIDDHVFVMFGVPLTREDDLSRALDCALELQRTRDELRPKGLALDFCMGLHCGEVSVGGVGRRVSYLARGNTTRLARRLSAAADHGEILVSDRVLRFMRPAFRLNNGPALKSRGGRAAVPSYRLEGRRSGLRVARQGPWLRRGEEIRHLQRAIGALADGNGRALAVVGPVGSGKSKLIHDVKRLARRRGIPFHVVPVEQTSTRHPFAGLVRQLFGVEGKDSLEQIEARLARGTEIGLQTNDLETLRWIAGVDIDRRFRREDVVAALEALLRSLSDGEGAVLALDVERLDRDSLRQLTFLIRRLADRSLLFLLSARPPLSPMLLPLVEQVPLLPVGKSELEKLLSDLLQAEDIAEPLLDLVASTCEGNALYAAEFVDYLISHDQILLDGATASLSTPPKVGLPDSLHGLISARIDALDAGSKGVLQLASLLTYAFDAQLVAHAAGLDDPSPVLHELSAAGLLRREGEHWVFATELVREAARRGLLGVRRRDCHRMLSSAIEAVHGDHLEDWWAELGRHCAKGGRPIDAARCARKAGQRLEKVGRLEEARAHYLDGLKWLAGSTDSADYEAKVQGEASLQLLIGTVSFLAGETERGNRAIHLALDIASDASLPWIEVQAHVALGRRALHEGEHQRAAAHLNLARELLVLEDDRTLELDVLDGLAGLALEEGRVEDADDLWSRALKRAAGDPHLVARFRSGLATRWLRAGRADEAGPFLEQALDAARVTGDRLTEGKVLNNMGLKKTLDGDFSGALMYFRRSLEVREEVGYPRGRVINHHNIGDAHFQLGDFARAHVAFTRSRQLAADVGWDRGCLLNDVYLAYLDRRGEEEPADLEPYRLRSIELGDQSTATTARWLDALQHLDRGREDDGRRGLALAESEAREHGLAVLEHAIMSHRVDPA